MASTILTYRGQKTDLVGVDGSSAVTRSAPLRLFSHLPHHFLPIRLWYFDEATSINHAVRLMGGLEKLLRVEIVEV